MNSNNQTGLHLAGQAGLLPALRLLLDAGAPVNQVDGVGKTSLDLANNSGNHSCRKLLLLWGAAPAKLQAPQRASSLPNLAAEITEDQSEDNSEEEEEEAIKNKAEDKADDVKERLEMDQELCQRVKEMQNELSELRKDVTRLRTERSKENVREQREEDKNVESLNEQLYQVSLVERTNKSEMAMSRSNEFLESMGNVSVTEGHNHPEGKESKNTATEIDSDFELLKTVPDRMNDKIPAQTEERETQCSLGAETCNSQNPEASAMANHQHQQPSLLGEAEELSFPRLPGVGLVQIPPLVLPPCTNHPTSTPPTRHSSTQCSLEVINNVEEHAGSSISSRNQNFVAADIGRRKKQQMLGSEVEEGDDQADRMPSQHLKRAGTSRIVVYDEEDQRSWDGAMQTPLEGEDDEERFQYSSDEEVPLQNLPPHPKFNPNW